MSTETKTRTDAAVTAIDAWFAALGVAPRDPAIPDLLAAARADLKERLAKNDAAAADAVIAEWFAAHVPNTAIARDVEIVNHLKTRLPALIEALVTKESNQ